MTIFSALVVIQIYLFLLSLFDNENFTIYLIYFIFLRYVRFVAKIK